MYTIFVILFLLSLVFLVIATIKPGTNKKTGKPYKRKDMAIGFGIIMIIFLALAGVTAPKTKPVADVKPKTTTVTATNKTKPAPQSKPVATKTTTASANPKPTTPAKPVLTGYGATLTEWNKTHTEDTRFTTDTAYNPEPNSAGGCNGDEYCAFTNSTNYQMSFPNGQSQATSQALVMQQFPSDTTILWQQKLTSDSPNVCYQMEVESSTLAQVLGGSGEAFVEFQTFTPSNNTGNIEYDADNVNSATINNIDYGSASDSTAC